MDNGFGHCCRRLAIAGMLLLTLAPPLFAQESGPIIVDGVAVRPSTPALQSELDSVDRHTRARLGEEMSVVHRSCVQNKRFSAVHGCDCVVTKALEDRLINGFGVGITHVIYRVQDVCHAPVTHAAYEEEQCLYRLLDLMEEDAAYVEPAEKICACTGRTAVERHPEKRSGNLTSIQIACGYDKLLRQANDDRNRKRGLP